MADDGGGRRRLLDQSFQGGRALQVLIHTGVSVLSQVDVGRVHVRTCDAQRHGWSVWRFVCHFARLATLQPCEIRGTLLGTGFAIE